MNFLLHHTPLFYLTQSLWRDEAFSVLLSERSPIQFIKITFEPPLYYVLLHYWMLIFGNSELAVRSLSVLGFSLATLIVIKWGELLFKKHWLSWFLPLFFFFNPMLLYYGFEARAYGWYIFFAVASMFCYMNKRWTWYVIATVLGLYTHTYMVIVPAVQALHYFFVTKKITVFKHIKIVARDPMIHSVVIMAVLFGPWFVRVVQDLSRLKQSWYFPVDLHLVKSVLGNIFLGYEGTPWFMWTHTARLSFLLLGASLYAIIIKHNRSRNSLFFLLLFVPLSIVIGISFYKPLFVNRYIIPSTIAEVFLVIFALEAISNKVLQKILGGVALISLLLFNMWYPDQHAKLDIRNTIKQINILKNPQDVILADSSLIFFESIYYSKDRSNVYLYNPAGEPFPWYVGDAIVSSSQFVKDIPPYPTRAFVVHVDGSYEIVYNTALISKPVGKRVILPHKTQYDK